jgi:hypothetical protein
VLDGERLANERGLNPIDFELFGGEPGRARGTDRDESTVTSTAASSRT